jgi:hypothetical protein
MRDRVRMIGLVVLLAVLVPSTAMAAGPLDVQSPDGKIVIGGTYTLASGQTLEGGLAVIGGIATLEAGSTVDGDVALLGGVLTADGTIDGDLAGIGAAMSLGPQSVVNGDLASIGSTVDRAEGSVVTGQVNSGVIIGGPIDSGAIILPGISELPRIEIPSVPSNPMPETVPGRPQIRSDVGEFFDWWPMQAIWYLVRSFLLAGLAMLAVLFVERPINRIAQASVEAPAAAGGIGCLTAIIVPLVLIFLALTICLIPFSVLGGLIFYAARLAGWIALGLEVGRRMGRSFQWNLQPPVAAGLGTLAMTLVVDGIGFIPCIGFVLRVLVATLGVGAVVLTRFGTREYVRPEAPLPPAMPEPPAPPVPPEPLPPPS